jgi:ribonuclease-3
MKKIPPFKNDLLLRQALTHRSYINENPDAGADNERLEFLGDALLNFLSGEYLYKRYQHMSEGKMTSIRSSLVDEKQLSEFAARLRIGERMLRDEMRLGRGAILEGGRQNPSLLSSTFEAIIGAYYLDSGSNIEAVHKFVEELFDSVIDDLIVTDGVVFTQSNIDYKSLFQQMALANIFRNPQRENPQYTTNRSGGTDDAPRFTAIVFVNKRPWGEGRGRSKKEAEKAAAEDAIARWNRVS